MHTQWQGEVTAPSSARPGLAPEGSRVRAHVISWGSHCTQQCTYTLLPSGASPGRALWGRVHAHTMAGGSHCTQQCTSRTCSRGQQSACTCDNMEQPLHSAVHIHSAALRSKSGMCTVGQSACTHNGRGSHCTQQCTSRTCSGGQQSACICGPWAFPRTLLWLSLGSLITRTSCNSWTF